MRSTRSDRSSTYTLVPQSVSDEDEGVFEESPESSQQQTELLSTESGEFVHPSCTSPDALELKSYNSSERIEQSPSPGFQPAVTISQLKPLSPARKCCFVACLFACVAYVMALIWLVPCHLLPCSDSHPNAKLPMIIKEWNVTLPLIESISEPRPVVISPTGETLFVFAFQLVQRNFSTAETVKNVEPASGVMALSGKNGSEIWKQMFYTRVEDVVCSITDVNLDNIPDCAIVGSMGLLAAINASNGHTFWYLHNHDEQPLVSDKVSPPRPLPDIDINRDGVRDLLVLGTLTTDYNERNKKVHNTNVVQLLLVSGSTGEIIGQPVSCPYRNLYNEARQIPTPTIIKLPNSTYSIIFAAQGCSKNSGNSGAVVVIGLNSFIKQALEQHFTQLLNLPNTKTNYTVYEDFCIDGRIQSIVIDNDDQSRGLIQTVNEKQHSILYSFRYSSSFQIQWKFQPENYTIKEILTGQFKSQKSIALVALEPKNCTSNNCQYLYIVMDMNDGKQLQSFHLNCPLSNILHFKQKNSNFATSGFILETLNTGQTNNFSSSMVFIVDNQLLSFNIGGYTNTSCKENKIAIIGVFENDLIIEVHKKYDGLSMRTVAVREYIPKPSASILVHPNQT